MSAFHDAVYAAIQEIPYGKVTTYGHIAALIGTPERPRQVGVCLKHLPSNPEAEFNNQTVPWQRVINSKGAISPRADHPGGARSQGEALRAEGVQVIPNEMGELRVDLVRYGWFPSRLPSEAAEAGSGSDGDDEDDPGDDGGLENVDDGKGGADAERGEAERRKSKDDESEAEQSPRKRRRHK